LERKGLLILKKIEEERHFHNNLGKSFRRDEKGGKGETQVAAQEGDKPKIILIKGR